MKCSFDEHLAKLLQHLNEGKRIESKSRNARIENGYLLGVNVTQAAKKKRAAKKQKQKT